MQDKTTAGVLALLLGGLGVHKFYLGQTGIGIIYLVFCWTLIPAILGVVDGIILLTMDQREFDHRYNPRSLLDRLERRPGVPVAPFVPAPPPHRQSASGDVVTQLKALHELKLSGALTDDEFSAQKKKLLG